MRRRCGPNRSKAIDINDGLSECLRGFLGQIVTNSATDEPVLIFTREFLGVRAGVGVWRAVGSALKSDGGHADGRSAGNALVQIVVFRLALPEKP
jgi:hypothetical protein